ncbi:GspH/FimT family pseudopilin [Litoribrevibacter albus]|uniref:Type II secretion system protein H n=1 Tax=Litoribrevibacter albus TaxID=1473156 RepID=A0AA37W9X5_9GAMM|nr:GspH/FimT family pseudopilin [Litoribrevibacter albus]GLQ33673.1 type IV minor pilin protein FimT [Litoribrevibacter albus]
MKKTLHGFSLVELTVVIAIVAITAYLAMPSFYQWKNKHNVEAAVSTLMDAINFTRYTAIETDSTITLCPTSDHQHCSKDWQGALMIFKDSNKDRTLNTDEELIRIENLNLEGYIKSESWFGSHRYLQMTPGGLTNNQNGRYTICPSNGDSQLARQIIINRRGKARLAKDWNQDGIVDGSKGNPVSCGTNAA